MAEDAVLQVFVFREGAYIGSELFSEQEIVVGRGERANLVLEDQDVGAEHLLLTLEDDGLALLKLGNGIVLLNGVPVDHARLSPRDEIRLGSHALKIKVLAQSSSQRPVFPPDSFFEDETNTRAPSYQAPAPEPAVLETEDDPLGREIAAAAKQDSAIEITGTDVLATRGVTGDYAASPLAPEPPPVQSGPGTGGMNPPAGASLGFASLPASLAGPASSTGTFDGVWDDAPPDDLRLEAALDAMFTVLEPTSPGQIVPASASHPPGAQALPRAPDDPESLAVLAQLLPRHMLIDSDPAIRALGPSSARELDRGLPNADPVRPRRPAEDEDDLEDGALPGFSLAEALIESADAANVTVLEDKQALEVIAFDARSVIATALLKRRSERYVIGKRLPRSESAVRSHGALKLAKVLRDGVAQIEFPSSAEGTVFASERSSPLDDLKIPSNAVSKTGDLYRTELVAGTRVTLALGEMRFHLRFIRPPAIPKDRRATPRDRTVGPSMLGSLGIHVAALITLAAMLPATRHAGARAPAAPAGTTARELALIAPRRIGAGLTTVPPPSSAPAPGTALEPPGQAGMRPSRPLGPRGPAAPSHAAKGSRKVRIARLLGKEIETKGSVAKEEIALVVEEHRGEIEACLAKARGTGFRSGRLVLEWTIDNDGTVVRPRQKTVARGEPAVDACIAVTLARWIFPDPPKGTPSVTAILELIDREAPPPAPEPDLAKSADLRATIAAFERPLSRDPADERLLDRFARALSAHGRFDPAIAYDTQAIALDPSNALFHLNRGLAEEQLGQTRQARADYAKASSLDPDLVAAHVAKGKLDLDVGRMRSAQRALTRAVQVAPKDPIARYDLGILYLRQRRDADALNELDQAIEADPNMSAAHNNRGIALARLGKRIEALAAFQRAAELRPEDREPAFNLARFHLLTGDLDAARRELKRVLALDPSSADARFHLAEIELSEGHKDRAFALYREALDAPAKDRAGDLRAARAYLERGEPERAVAQLQRAHAEESRDPRTLDLLGTADAAIGTPAALEWAEAAFDRAAKLDPASPEIRVRWARVEAQLERPARAEALLRAALELEPGHREATLELGGLLATTAGADRAEALYRAAVLREPSFAEAHYRLGRIHRARKERPAERAAYVSAILVDPSHLQARVDLGRSYYEGGQNDRAIDELQRAIALDSSFALAHAYLAEAYGSSDFDEEARAQIERALEADPELTLAHQALGALERKLGNLEPARKAYRRAVELDPDNSEAAAALADLERAIARGGKAEGGKGPPGAAKKKPGR